MAFGASLHLKRPLPRGEGEADREADRKLAHNTLPGPVDARPPTSYAAHDAIGLCDAMCDAMDEDYRTQRTHSGVTW